MSSLFPVPAVAAAILALTLATACQARNDAMPISHPGPDATPAIGLWEIRPADAAVPGLCRLALREDARADGHAVVMATCELKAANRAHHWRSTPTGFALVDAAGATLISFAPESPDAWTGLGADGTEYRMIRAAMF